jgi:predicted CxxxxCH...CXXCH cytochrome family protein
VQHSTGSARARFAGPAWAGLCALWWCAAVGCETRERPAQAPTYDGNVGALFEARCAECHGAEDPAAGWSVTTYLDALACTTEGVPVTVGASTADEEVDADADAGTDADGLAPLLAVLDRADHADLVDAAERALLEDWVATHTPKNEGPLHPVGWLDPRSAAWHGTAARADDWLLLRNPKLDDSCGRCHAGAPSREPALDAPPESAPACTSCHSEPGGVLACSTCHGHDASGEPPRDACFFPDGPLPGAHAAHLDGAAFEPLGLQCAACHPAPDPDLVLYGKHADGTLDVAFDAQLGGAEASYAEDEQRCAVACHTRGGEREQPRWSESGPLGCNDCHGSPPPAHYQGACSTCHPGVNADGTALDDESQHIDGVVSLGEGGATDNGSCGGCHGSGDDPWPTTGAHPAHASSSLSASVACESCHVVPDSVMAPGHLDSTPGAELTFAGLALARGSEPVYDATTGSCSEVACHGAALSEPPPAWPRWRTAAPGAALCGSCHGVPPGAPHSQEKGCESLICHGSEIAQWPEGPRITPSGQTLHVNGAIDVSRP